MSRKLEPGKLVIASHNPGKVREIADLLRPHGMDVVSASELDLPEPEETEDSFAGNAELKARAAAEAAKLPALSDDSGLCVHSLGDHPGVYSARWAGPDKNFGAAMGKIEEMLQELGPKTPRNAFFICALSLAWPDGHIETFEGRVDGTMVWPPRGENGFGYDPVFMPVGHDITFGEMEPNIKHAMSHRAHAFGKLIKAIF
ncbi:RdgB/HAM1 family non-canonical purine NTP pyrophosphatase [Parasphingopyxis sp. CP4]|uniref:RdgB/HAM1 family non-canonical purine NTP pyrophosphatase n=1 Tax=Parasphingopyxis sp. CP4 TaxID=2724527 RepID=UPI0015A312D3|nr:RdgB/HAM1 family non-canonical purine NTP pyrophosphatase [Parasphingopyxis sp. CP4]QLC21110.1 RdgB/HAM1 family non-canonical purine NTP pyrophosphatase [Parasphingopyxis sp. CP4]